MSSWFRKTKDTSVSEEARSYGPVPTSEDGEISSTSSTKGFTEKFFEANAVRAVLGGIWLFLVGVVLSFSSSHIVSHARGTGSLATDPLWGVEWQIGIVLCITVFFALSILPFQPITVPTIFLSWIYQSINPDTSKKEGSTMWKCMRDCTMGFFFVIMYLAFLFSGNTVGGYGNEIEYPGDDGDLPYNDTIGVARVLALSIIPSFLYCYFWLIGQTRLNMPGHHWVYKDGSGALSKYIDRDVIVTNLHLPTVLGAITLLDCVLLHNCAGSTIHVFAFLGPAVLSGHYGRLHSVFWGSMIGGALAGIVVYLWLRSSRKNDRTETPLLNSPTTYNLPN